MNLLNEIEMVSSLDVESYQSTLVSEGFTEPSEDDSLEALHRARYRMACDKQVDKALGEESAAWLKENGHSFIQR